ncbi:MAG: hypothetical protein ABH952_00565 [Candidatus Omnitrophota bacterium]
MIIFFMLWIIVFSGFLFFLSSLKDPYTKNTVWQVVVPVFVVIFCTTLFLQDVFVGLAIFAKIMIILVMIFVIFFCNQIWKFCDICGEIVVSKKRKKCKKCGKNREKEGGKQKPKLR